jgi:hypothetical protein
LPLNPDRELGHASGVLWAVASLAALAALLSRAVEPALPGVWVGVDHVITAVKLVSAISSQLFAVSSSAVMIGLVLATVRSRLPPHLRAFSVCAGVLVVLAVLIASAVRLPNPSRLVLAFTAAALSLMAAKSSARFLNLRAAALLLAVMSVASLVRIIAIVFAGYANAGAPDAILLAARVAATVGSAVEALGVLVAVAWLVLKSPRTGKRPEPRWQLLAVTLVLGLAGTFVVHLGLDPESSGGALLVARAVRRLLLLPEPYLPLMLRVVVEVLLWLVVLLTLVLTPRSRLMSAVVALALVARGTPDIPLCAMAMVLASLALLQHPGPDLRNEIDRLEDAHGGRRPAG